MKNQPPYLIIYGRSHSEALEIIWRYGLRHTELVNQLVPGISFEDEKDLTAFALMFGGQVVFENRLAIIPPGLAREVEAFIEQCDLNERVKRHDLLAVEFWDTDDQAVFDAALGIP